MYGHPFWTATAEYRVYNFSLSWKLLKPLNGLSFIDRRKEKKMTKLYRAFSYWRKVFHVHLEVLSLHLFGWSYWCLAQLMKPKNSFHIDSTFAAFPSIYKVFEISPFHSTKGMNKFQLDELSLSISISMSQLLREFPMKHFDVPRTTDICDISLHSPAYAKYLNKKDANGKSEKKKRKWK